VTEVVDPDTTALMPRAAQHGRGLRNRYTASRVVILLGVYWRIHGDLMSVEFSDPRIAEPVRQCLAAAKESLEGRKPDTLSAAGYLSLADRQLLRILPDDLLMARCAAVLAELELLESGGHAPRSATKALHAACVVNASPQDRRAALDAAIAMSHSMEAKDAIEDSLQVRRLQHLLAYCGLLAALLLVTSPLLSARSGGWPLAVDDGGYYLSALTVSAGLMLLGAVGGLFSRLLQVRDGRTSLLTYRTDMLKLGLSPLIGGMAALIVHLLAGWKLITVLEAGPGGLILVALVAGFSEKYILRLLRMPVPSDHAGGDRHDP
jgi:hypothetical protein